jgi:acyl dehydratase
MRLTAGDVKVGDTREVVLVENLTRTQIVQYAGASGDYNPLHTDEVFATQVAGFPSVFAHGMLTMGITGRLLTDWVGDGRLASYGARFVAQVWPGDTLTGRATVTAVRQEEDGSTHVDLSIETRNQRDEVVLTGTAAARLPGDGTPSREVALVDGEIPAGSQVDPWLPPVPGVAARGSRPHA